jgi:acetyl esterase
MGAGSSVANSRPELQVSFDKSPLAPDVKAAFPGSFAQWLGHTLPISVLRKAYDAAGVADNPPLKCPVVEEEILHPVSGDFPDATVQLRSRLYQPASLKESKAEAPLIVYYHGGGFALGSAGGGSHQSTCRFLAAETGFRLVSLDYRRSPEVKFPVPLRDGMAGYEYVCSHPELFGLPKDLSKAKIIVTGDSAGAAMTLSTIFKVRDHNRAAAAASPAASSGAGAMPSNKAPLIKPILAMPFYPGADRRTTTPMRDSECRYFSGYILTSAMVRGMMLDFFGPDQAKYDNDPEANLIVIEDFADLPETVLLTAECDLLRDEGIAFYEKAKAKGANITHVPCAGLPHGFLTHLEKWTTARQKTVEMAALMVERAK